MVTSLYYRGVYVEGSFEAGDGGAEDLLGRAVDTQPDITGSVVDRDRGCDPTRVSGERLPKILQASDYIEIGALGCYPSVMQFEVEDGGVQSPTRRPLLLMSSKRAGSSRRIGVFSSNRLAIF